MKPFEKMGYWWLPDSPENRVAGTIRSDEDGGLHLSLIGAFNEVGLGSFGGDARKVPVILGIAREDSSEKKVTLTGTFVNKQSFNFHGVSFEQYYAHHAFWGDHLPHGDEPAFRSVSLQFSGLSSWASSLSGFDRKDREPFMHSWERVEPVKVETSEGTALLGVAISSEGGWRKRVLTERVVISLTFHHPRAAADIDRNVTYPLQNLLTLATDRPNACMEEKLKKRGDDHEGIVLTGPRVFSDAESGTNLLPPEMLFTLDDVKDRFGAILDQWFAMSKRHAAAFAVYFSNVYDPPGFIDVRFQLLVQAISIYAIGAISPGEKVKRLDQIRHIGGLATLGQAAIELIASNPIVSGEIAIAGLLEAHGRILAPIIGGNSPSARSTLVDQVARQLQSIGRGDGPLEERDDDGLGLYWLKVKIEFLFKVALLAELGIGSSEIETIIHRHRLFQHLMRLASKSE